MSLLSANLQAFMAVKAHLTVASAAHSLKLTQAAVTLRIQNLERDTEATLFVRSRRGMRLTNAGEVLARYCQRVMEIEAEVLPDLNPAATTSMSVPLVVQGPSSAIKTRVLPYLESYLKKHQIINLEIRVDDLGFGIDRLKSGACDIVIAQRSHVGKEFDSKLLKPERYILVAPMAWKKREPREIIAEERMIDFDPSDTMTTDFLEKFQLIKSARADRHFVNITDYISALLVDGLGYSVLPEQDAAAHLKDGTLFNMYPGKTLNYEIALAWYPRKQMPQSFRDFIKMVL
jgi:LysR family transcriptional regulator, chromosome initiation inhibitor